EVTYPQKRLEEEGATVTVIGAAPAGTKYTGKFGYPVLSHATISAVSADEFEALVIPGGFSPDYMRRSVPMLNFIVRMLAMDKPVAAICHGAWMFCSARDPQTGRPVCDGYRCTGFAAIKDDLINAGATWVDQAVVVDRAIITARTPADLTPFCHAIIQAVASKLA
ncbi:protease/amidase, partial [Pavlovales sp. CCMP2436]